MTLTVIMPAYNEEGAIEAAIREVQDQVLAHVPESSMIVVNDGSKDRTGAILDGIAAKDPRIHPLHQVNGGHGAALMNGLHASKSEWVMLIDSDRQIPLTTFPEAWARALEGDGAFGIRKVRMDALVRVVLTRFIRVFILLTFFRWIRDANVPFKILKRSLWRKAARHIPTGTLAPSLFLTIYAYVRGFAIAEVPVQHKDRETGEVSIRKWKLFKFCLRGLGQLVRFRFSLWIKQ